MAITDLDSIFRAGEPWPPTSEAARLQAYERYSRLYEGDHDAVFADLNPKELARVGMDLNWFRRVCTLFSDLLWGETPRFEASKGQEALDRILEVNRFHLTAYDATVDLVKYGTGLFKIRFDKRGIIEVIDPRLWFPVCNPDNAAEVTAHILAWTVYKPDEDGKDEPYLRLEIHHPGKIENRLYKLKEGKIEKAVDLATIDRYKDLADEITTGIEDFLVVPVHNLKASNAVAGRSDLADLEDVVHEIEKRAAQISRVLDQHADPKLIAPSNLVTIDPTTGQAFFTASGSRVYIVNEGEKEPSYLTWNAELEYAFRQIEVMKDHLQAVGEISPAILGDVKNGLAESGSALKRLALPTLAKVNRLRQRIDPQLKEVLRICADLEIASRMSGATSIENLTIAWRDGLPADAMENVQVENLRTVARLTSRRAALSRLDEGATEKDIDAELEAIEKELEADRVQVIDNEPLKLEMGEP